MARATTVDQYLEQRPEWDGALQKLRRALTAAEFQQAGLEETVKWGAPCYTLGGKNVVGIGAFKAYVGLWFHQGALLADPDGVLINAGEGKTKALRQWRFTAERDIPVARVKAYVREAIANQAAGKEVPVERNKAVDVPPELAAALRADQATANAFAGLTPGKQREYAEHIASAKRPATKESRIAKSLPLIRAGVGLHDKYRNC